MCARGVPACAGRLVWLAPVVHGSADRLRPEERTALVLLQRGFAR